MCKTTKKAKQIEAENKQKELQDVSIPVYKILSCIRQMDQAFNKEIVSATLRGVKNKTIFHLELHRLAAYGSLIRYGQNQIDHLMQLLFDEGVLRETSGRYKSIKLAEPARELLQKKRSVFTRLPAKMKHEV